MPCKVDWVTALTTCHQLLMNETKRHEWRCMAFDVQTALHQNASQKVMFQMNKARCLSGRQKKRDIAVAMQELCMVTSHNQEMERR